MKPIAKGELAPYDGKLISTEEWNETIRPILEKVDQLFETPLTKMEHQKTQKKIGKVVS